MSRLGKQKIVPLGILKNNFICFKVKFEDFGSGLFQFDLFQTQADLLPSSRINNEGALGIFAHSLTRCLAKPRKKEGAERLNGQIATKIKILTINLEY